jgi:carnosine N-methyltransferase
MPTDDTKYRFLYGHRATQPGEFEIHPWIHNPSNALAITDLLRPVQIPDVSPTQLLGLDKGNRPDFSMCAGEFLEAYANDKGASSSHQVMLVFLCKC